MNLSGVFIHYGEEITAVVVKAVVKMWLILFIIIH